MRQLTTTVLPAKRSQNRCQVCCKRLYRRPKQILLRSGGQQLQHQQQLQLLDLAPSKEDVDKSMLERFASMLPCIHCRGLQKPGPGFLTSSCQHCDAKALQIELTCTSCGSESNICAICTYSKAFHGPASGRQTYSVVPHVDYMLEQWRYLESDTMCAPCCDLPRVLSAGVGAMRCPSCNSLAHRQLDCTTCGKIERLCAVCDTSHGIIDGRAGTDNSEEEKESEG